MDTRPAHQKAIEDAINRGDFSTAKKITDMIPDSDPYKASMKQMLGLVKGKLTPNPQSPSNQSLFAQNLANQGQPDLTSLRAAYDDAIKRGDSVAAEQLGRKITDPALSNYQDAMSQGNLGIVQSLSAQFPNDARFQTNKPVAASPQELRAVPDTQKLFVEHLVGQPTPPEVKGGTTRDVYDLGNSVAKVAKDPKGLQQNEQELKNVPMTPQPLAKGKDFVIAEKAQRDDKLINAWLKPLRDYSSSDYEKKDPKLIGLMEAMGLKHFTKYPLLWGDFTARRNWGIDKNGQPTLLDKGTLNTHIYDHDQAPKPVQDQYEKIKEQRQEVKQTLKEGGVNNA